MSLAEKLLLLFSKKPEMNLTAEENWTTKNSLSLLEASFPHFMDSIIGKRILDFGCGNGYQTIALAKSNVAYVYGVDKNHLWLKNARKLLDRFDHLTNVKFLNKIEIGLNYSFDIVISQNSFEHFTDPIGVLDSMKRLLKPGGKIFIVFGPPWYAPYGSHMHYFVKIPWVNIFFPEKAIMSVRSMYRNDGAKKFKEVEGGLNKMSISKFNNIILSSKLTIELLEYDCVKSINFLSKIPFAREFFINRVRCILSNV